MHFMKQNLDFIPLLGSGTSQYTEVDARSLAVPRCQETCSPDPLQSSTSLMASSVGQCISNLSNIPPGANITFMMGNFYASRPELGSSDASSTPRQPVVVPHELRRELSIRLNADDVSLTGSNWIGLAVKLDLDEYIEPLKLSKNPTEEIIKIAEYQKQIKSLDDLMIVFRRMKRHDCIEVIEKYYAK